MTTSTVLAATWNEGIFVLAGNTPARRELPGQPVSALVPDGRGGALAVVAGHSLRRRTAGGEWTILASSGFPLSSCAPAGDVIYLGTDDASLLRLNGTGDIERLHGFDAAPGRDGWYAGSAVIDGQRVGPPLGIRSIAVTADTGVLLANVHVGGVPRSVDRGVTWRPTIEIDADVHEVCAHPDDPDRVIAAAAAGCCISDDGGSTWRIERDGLHAPYCSAVAFLGDDVLVSAATGHFATEGAVYRRAIGARSPFVPVGGGLPRWLDGIVDTRCIATDGSTAAIADRAGNVYLSTDGGSAWLRIAEGLPLPSSVVIV
jgi:hypothetical protein